MMLQFPQIVDNVKKERVLDFFYSSKLKDIGTLIIEVTDSFYNKSIDNERRDSVFDINGAALISDVMTSTASEADKELIASLAMMEFADADDIVEKSSFLIKRIIHVRKRSDSTLTHEIRKIEQLNKSTQSIDISEEIAVVKQDSGIDPTLEPLRQRQSEIRQLHGYE